MAMTAQKMRINHYISPREINVNIHTNEVSIMSFRTAGASGFPGWNRRHEWRAFATARNASTPAFVALMTGRFCSNNCIEEKMNSLLKGGIYNYLHLAKN